MQMYFDDFSHLFVLTIFSPLKYCYYELNKVILYFYKVCETFVNYLDREVAKMILFGFQWCNTGVFGDAEMWYSTFELCLFLYLFNYIVLSELFLFIHIYFSPLKYLCLI